MIKRIDKTFGEPKVTHDTEDDAITEAKRLCEKHASASPEFVIYELVPHVRFRATLSIEESDPREE